MKQHRLKKYYYDALQTILKRRLVPRRSRGISVAHDIKRLLRGYAFDVVFDVGANVGRSAGEFLEEMQPRRLYCFEPVRQTYEKLRRNVGGHAHVQVCHLALGRRAGSTRMVVHERSVLSRIMAEEGNADSGGVAETEAVDMVTMDEFCAGEGVARVSYLKIDTEGNDRDVLTGAERLLAEQAIDFIEVEVGMNPANHYHVPMEDMKRHLEERNYSAFGIYEQMHEWPTHSPRLRRVNMVFISGALAGE